MEPIWLSFALCEKFSILVNGEKVDIPADYLADNCVGVMFAFKTKRAAKRHSDAQILRLTKAKGDK